MARSIATISLSPERAAQFQQVAKARQVSLNELVGRLVQSEVRAGTIADAIPGYEVVPRKGRVEISIGKFRAILKTSDAVQFAAALTSVADDASAWEVRRANGRKEAGKSYPEFFERIGDDVFALRRRGRGLVLGINQHNKRPAVRKSMGPDIARDLARILRAAAKKAGR